MMFLLAGCLGSDSGRMGASAVSDDEAVNVVVAVTDVAIGGMIGTDDIVVRQLPASCVASGETFAALEDVLGRIAKARILAGEPVRIERLASPTAELGLAALITPGKRAVTVSLGPSDGWTPLMQRGNYLDISWAPVLERTRDPQRDGGRTLFQAVKILAVDHLIGAEGEPAPTRYEAGQHAVTLEVSHPEVPRLLVARASGGVLVSLRSDLDPLEQAPGGAVSIDLLRNGVPAEPPGAPGDHDHTEEAVPPEEAPVVP